MTSVRTDKIKALSNFLLTSINTPARRDIREEGGAPGRQNGHLCFWNICFFRARFCSLPLSGNTSWNEQGAVPLCRSPTGPCLGIFRVLLPLWKLLVLSWTSARKLPEGQAGECGRAFSWVALNLNWVSSAWGMCFETVKNPLESSRCRKVNPRVSSGWNY